MPSDIVGTEVLEEKAGSGPSASSKARLRAASHGGRDQPRKPEDAIGPFQAMQEHQVTFRRQTYELPTPFFVLATQNPLEQEGTYPLPEAQLDRFLLQIDVTYPDAAAERRMLFSTTGDRDRPRAADTNADEVMAAQRLLRGIPTGDSVVDAILKLVRSARPKRPKSHRASTSWWPGGRVRAPAGADAHSARPCLLDGRFAPSVDDVIALGKTRAQASHGARPYGAHRNSPSIR